MTMRFDPVKMMLAQEQLLLAITKELANVKQELQELKQRPQIIKQYAGGGIRRSAADNRYVNESGDTMTGNLNMDNNNITNVDDLDGQTATLTMAAADTLGLKVDGATNDYSGSATNYGCDFKRDISTGTSAGFTNYLQYLLTNNLRGITNNLGSGGTMQTYAHVAAAVDSGNYVQGALPLAPCIRQIYGLYFSGTYSGSDLQGTSSNALQIWGSRLIAQNIGTINKSSGTLDCTIYGAQVTAIDNPTYTAGTYVSNVYGVWASASGSTNGVTTCYGLWARAKLGDTNWAGYFDEGDVYVRDEFNCGDIAQRADKTLVFAEGSDVTISGGVITIASVNTVVKPEAGAADDLDTINGGTDGEVIIIRGDGVATVTVKDGSGNINCAGDFAMDAAADTMMLMYDGTNSEWLELSRSNNA